MNKKIICVFISILLCTSLFGCGKDDIYEGVVLWVNCSEEEKQYYNELVEQFSEETNIEAKVAAYEVDADNYSSFAKSDKSRADVVWGASSEDLEKLIGYETIEELQEDIYNSEDYISEDLIENTSFEGKRYAIPVFQESVALFYNKDLVTEVPTDMEELLKLSEEKGFGFNINDGYFSYGFIASFGGYVYKNNNGTFDSEDVGLWNDGAIKGYEVLQDIGVKYNLVEGDINDENAETYFANGYKAFYLGEAKKIKSFEDLGMNFGVCKVPSIDGNDFKSFKAVKMAFVNPYAKDKDDSYKLLEYLAENAGNLMIEHGDRVPVLKKDIESDLFKNNEYLQGFYEQIKVAEVTPNIFKLKIYWSIISRNLELLTSDQITPNECAESLKRDYYELIE